MVNNSASPGPSFFKPLINDFYTKLRLPNVFVQKYCGLMHENMKLRMKSRKSWDVMIEEEEDGKEWHITKGWNEFVEDLELKEFQMLLFCLDMDDDAIFHVTVYSSNTCEREISFTQHAPLITQDEKSWPRYEFVLTESKKIRMSLRKEFAGAAGLNGKRSVVLQYGEKERYWAAHLQHRPHPYNSLDLCKGWNDFGIQNGLVVGRTYSLLFNPSKNLILVECSQN